MSKRSKIAILAVYGMLMLWLLFGQRMGQGSQGILQLEPLHTLKQFWWVLRNSSQPGLRTHAWINLAGNVAMFVPLGFLMPWIWSFWRKFGWHFLLMVAVIILVELAQYFLGLGTCDVDDLLLNLVGTSLGFLFEKMVRQLSRS